MKLIRPSKARLNGGNFLTKKTVFFINSKLVKRGWFFYEFNSGKGNIQELRNFQIL